MLIITAFIEIDTKIIRQITFSFSINQTCAFFFKHFFLHISFFTYEHLKRV
jgi:hypothetical protein